MDYVTRKRIAVALAVVWGTGVGAAAGVVWEERFNPPAAESGWKVRTAEGNLVTFGWNGVKIEANQNTYALVSRELGRDRVRVMAELMPSAGASWAPALFLYWDERNWCAVTAVQDEHPPVGGWLGGKGGGTYVVTEMVDGVIKEVKGPATYWRRWHLVGMELGEDCVRFVAGAAVAGEERTTVIRVIDRPGTWRGGPARVMVGKGYGEVGKYPGKELENSYAEAGPRTVSVVRRVKVEELAPGRERLSASEREERNRDGIDVLGERERRTEPTFESVASHFPGMLFPKESIGLPEHPEDVAVWYDGSIVLGGNHSTDWMDPANPAGVWEVDGRALGRELGECRKSLVNGGMPVVVCRYEREGVKFEQTVCGASEGLRVDRPLVAYSRMRVVNASGVGKKVAMRFRMNPTERAVGWTVELGAGESKEIAVRVGKEVLEEADVGEFGRVYGEVVRRWEEVLGEGMRIDVPERRVVEAARAWVGYGMVNVDTVGGRPVPYDGHGFYEAVYGYSACLFARAMDEWGHHDLARRVLEGQVAGVPADGPYLLNFGVGDTGALMAAVAEHYRLTGDGEWMRRVAPAMVRLCDWVARERGKSVKEAPEIARGLLKYRPYADHPEPAYSYFTDTILCVGMERMAGALAAVGMGEEAGRIGAEAGRYRGDILRSMDAAVVEHEGRKYLPVMPVTGELLKAGGYRTDDYYGLVLSMMLDTDFFEPADGRARLMTEALEQRGGLVLGCQAWRGGIDHAYAVGYLREVLRRGEGRKAVLGFYGFMAYGMSRETYSGVEIANFRTGDNSPSLPHTYSCSSQLRLLREMLVSEDEGRLVLGAGVPEGWLGAGKRVAVELVPTSFGEVGYSIEVAGDGRSAVVRVDPPRRGEAKGVEVRLRGRKVEGVEDPAGVVEGVSGEVVRMKGVKSRAEVRVRFGGG